MAKFELPIYGKNGEVIKTAKRDFVPIDLFIRFQKLSERLIAQDFKDDAEMFDEIEKAILEAFPTVTKDELRGGTDMAYLLYIINDIVSRAAMFEGSSDVSKN